MNAQRMVLELQPDAFLPLRDLKGAKVACLQGVLWITHDNDPHDILLRAGEAYQLTRKSAAVQAIGASRMAIEPSLGALPVPRRLTWGRGGLVSAA